MPVILHYRWVDFFVIFCTFQISLNKQLLLLVPFPLPPKNGKMNIDYRVGWQGWQSQQPGALQIYIRWSPRHSTLHIHPAPSALGSPLCTTRLCSALEEVTLHGDHSSSGANPLWQQDVAQTPDGGWEKQERWKNKHWLWLLHPSERSESWAPPGGCGMCKISGIAMPTS